MKLKLIVRGITVFLMAFALYTQVIWAILASLPSMQKDPITEVIIFFPLLMSNFWTIKLNIDLFRISNNILNHLGKTKH